MPVQHSMSSFFLLTAMCGGLRCIYLQLIYICKYIVVRKSRNTSFLYYCQSTLTQFSMRGNSWVKTYLIFLLHCVTALSFHFRSRKNHPCDFPQGWFSSFRLFRLFQFLLPLRSRRAGRSAQGSARGLWRYVPVASRTAAGRSCARLRASR